MSLLLYLLIGGRGQVATASVAGMLYVICAWAGQGEP